MLLGTEEQRQVIQALLHWIKVHVPSRRNDVQAYDQTAFPKAEPAGTQMKQKAKTIYIDIERV
jgi:hypothetical protein